MEINIKQEIKVCPVCQRDDSIQKVSAVVSGGTLTGNFSGPTSTLTSDGDSLRSGFGFTTVSGSAKSDLAKLLSPPPKPKEHRYDQGCGFGILVFVVTLGGFFLGAIILGEVFGELGGIIASLAIVLGIASIYSYKAIMYKRNDYPVLMKAYKKALERWERAYFCHRDDIVFDPYDGKTCVPDKLILDFYYSDFVR